MTVALSIADTPQPSTVTASPAPATTFSPAPSLSTSTTTTMFKPTTAAASTTRRLPTRTVPVTLPPANVPSTNVPDTTRSLSVEVNVEEPVSGHLVQQGRSGGFLPDAATTAVATTAVVATAAASVFLPSSASQPARLMASGKLRQCGLGLQAPSRLEHPAMPVANNAIHDPSNEQEVARKVALAAISSAAVVVVFAGPGSVLVAIGWGLQRRPAPGFASVLGALAGTATSYLLPGVAGAVAGVLYRGLETALAAMALIVGLCVLVLQLAGMRRNIRSRLDDGSSHETVSGFHAMIGGFAGGVRSVAHGSASAVVAPTTRVDSSSSSLAMAAAVSTSTRTLPLVQWYYAIDVGVATAFTAAVGVQPSTQTGCSIVACVGCGIALAFAVYVVWLRPLQDWIEQRFTAVAAVGQLVLALTVSVGLLSDDDKTRDAMFSAFDAGSLLLTALFVLQAVVLLGVEIARYLRRERSVMSAARTAQAALGVGDGNPAADVPLLTMPSESPPLGIKRHPATDGDATHANAEPGQRGNTPGSDGWSAQRPSADTASALSPSRPNPLDRRP